MDNKIAICLNCYYKSNISKLISQLSSLLMKSNDKYKYLKLRGKAYLGPSEIITSNITFKSINQCINYLKSQGFTETKTKNIHVALYCDGLSGQVYENINDFKNRIDIKEFNEIFSNKIFKIESLKCLPYFIYILSPSLFPEIRNKIIEFIKQNNTDTTKQLNEFKNIPEYIFDKIDFNIDKPNNIVLYQYIYNTYFKDVDFSKRIRNLIYSNQNEKYKHGFKLAYSSFIELYQLQPELFQSEIENYFNTKFENNYTENIEKIKEIFNEFNKIYPNSSLQGTYYHTNLMINRTRFLNDFDEYYKFFIDDDDITGGLDNYYSIYKWYNKNVKINYDELNNIIKYIDLKLVIKDYDKMNVDELNKNQLNKNENQSQNQNENINQNENQNENQSQNQNENINQLNKNENQLNKNENQLNKNENQSQNQNKNINLNENQNENINQLNENINQSQNKIRKQIKEIIENNINNPLGRYLYITYTKYCIFKFNVWNGFSIQNNICAMWNDIIPPYLPLNFLNIQETRCEDSSFNGLHFVNNFINNQEIIYYYTTPSLNNYSREKNIIVELKIKSIFKYLHKNKLSYLKMNHGRWFYNLNNTIKFIDYKNNIKHIKICDYNDLNSIL